MPEQESAKKPPAIIERAKKDWKRCESAEHDYRIDSLDDLKFRAGEQWPEKIKAIRDAQDRPCLTVNVLPARERQILNDQRQNRPSIHVNPVDDYGDPDTAEVLQGIVRHIEYDSNAEAAYDTACASQVRGGFGYIGLLTEYETPLDEVIDKVDPGAGKKKIKIRRFRNPFQVYLDPDAQEADKSDAKFGFAFAYLTKDEYQEKYGKKETTLGTLDDWTSIGDREAAWIDEAGKARIAEYYYQDRETKTCCQYSDGTVSVVPDDPKKRQQREAYLDKRGVKPVKDFEAELPVIRCCTIDGYDELESTTLPGSGKWIPLVPVLGDELEVDGKLSYEGLVRHTKDACRMQNYLASCETEAIGISKSGSWLAAEGQLEGHEKEWADPNPRVLVYKSVDVNGKLVPEPKLVVAEPAIQAITQARAQFNMDLQNITGIFDAQLGQRSNETTGKAITARKQQGQIGNFHYIDNLTRAIRHLGRLIIDWIPDVYDTPRVLRIIGEDGEQETVKVNQPFQQGGVQKIYDLTVGRYDVTVSAGPSYQTKRQEAADSMIQMTQAYPALMQVAGDLLAKNLDWPGAHELADRLKKTLPPGLADDDEGDPKQQVQVLKGQLQQAGQATQALNAYAQQLEKEKEGKVIENQGRAELEQLKASTQLAIEKMKIEAQIAIAEINTKAQNERERIKLEADLNAKLAVQDREQAHELGMTAVNQGHEQDMAASQQVHEMTMGERQHAQTLEQQDQAGEQAMMQQQMAAENQQQTSKQGD